MKPSKDIATIQIEKLVAGGSGLGFFQEKAVFVPFTAPGEIVKVQIQRGRKNTLEGKLLEVVQPSSERINPPCPYFSECGGCQWMHLTYDAQLRWKQNIVIESLKKIGKIENPKVFSTLPSPKQLGWRSRVTLHADESGKIGFFAPQSHRVVDIEECLIAEGGINQQLKKLRQENKNQKRDYEVRTTDEKSFTQVNPLQNETLKNIVREWAQNLPHDFIVELFCGSGNLTQVLIPLAKKILGIDSDRSAIEAAQKLKTLNPKTETEFICTDAVRYFARLADSTEPKIPIDLLVLDPPRDGASGVVEGVLKNRPKNILYISCKPATLARDIKYLKEFAGYDLIQCQPLDMFPHSHHVETITWIGQK